MVTQSLLQQYRREVESASNDARNYLTAMCEAYIEVNPNASVADMRKFAIETLQDGLNMYGDEAKVIANDFFDRLAQEANSKATAEMFDSTDADIVEQKVRYYAKSLADGDTSKFIKDVSDLTGFYVKREAFCNMAKNCDKAGIRYARVPSGRETCAFCFMLASRGFVYWGEKEAGAEGHEYHPHCDCIIVPGFHADTGISEDTQIEGYAPSEMRERYKKCYDAINPNGTWDEVYEQWKNSDQQDTWEKFKTKTLLKEIGTRDWKWLWTGTPAEVKYIKSEEALTENEKKAVNVLSNNGIKVIVNEQNDGKPVNIDFSINGRQIEHKNVTSDSSVSSQINRGRSQFFRAKESPATLIFTDTGSKVSNGEIYESIKKRIHEGEEWMLVRGESILKIKG
jgi:hypothetical protein